MEEEKKPKKFQPSPDIETDAEEILREKMPPINQRKSIFDEKAIGKRGINTAPSVFQQKAVFQTNGNIK